MPDPFSLKVGMKVSKDQIEPIIKKKVIISYYTVKNNCKNPSVLSSV
jgi:hypothetical protein